MADIVKTEKTAKFDLLFVDGDTRTLNIKNPKDGITTSQITAFQTFLQTSNALVGDKAEGTFGKIKKVTIRQKTTTTFGLTE